MDEIRKAIANRIISVGSPQRGTGSERGNIVSAATVIAKPQDSAIQISHKDLRTLRDKHPLIVRNATLAELGGEFYFLISATPRLCARIIARSDNLAQRRGAAEEEARE